MKVRLTDHAKVRLLWRNIDVSKALSTVKSPDWTHYGKGGTMLARKSFEGRLLEVVYSVRGGDAVIITAIYKDQAGNRDKI